MRILLLLQRVAQPSECALGAMDTDWVRDLAATHDVVLSVDDKTDGMTALGALGITTHVSDKRYVHVPGGEQIDADTALARWVVGQHDEVPFDLVVATPERPLLGPVAQALDGVPWAVLAAAGPSAQARRLGLDTDWLDEYGQSLWRAASRVAGADLVVSPVAVGHLGLDVRDTPVVSLTPAPQPDLRDVVAGRLVVVAMTGTSVLDATETTAAALAAIDVDEATTVVVLHSRPLEFAASVRPAIMAAVPPELEAQVVLVPVGPHERAADWLDAADALVLADVAELSIPAIARRAQHLPSVLVTDPGPGWATPELDAPPQVRPAATTELLPWTDPAAVAEALRRLRRTTGPDVVLLHSDTGATRAANWMANHRLDRFDVVVAARPEPPFDSPRTRWVAGDLVALHRRTWTAVAAALDTATELPALIHRLVDIAGLVSHTIGALSLDREPPVMVGPRNDAPAIDLRRGPLLAARPPFPGQPSPERDPSPEPEPAPVEDELASPDEPDEPDPEPEPEPEPEDTTPPLQAWIRTTRWTDRARLALPWSLGLGRVVADEDLPDGVVDWARHHTIGDRARLLLPWRWGLLPRAMEDDW